MKIDLSPVEVLFKAYDDYRASYNQKNGNTPHSVGCEIYCATFVLMSSLLQFHVENIFEECVKKRLYHLKTKDEIGKFWNVVGRNKNWGNPNPDSINSLFLHVGIINVMEGYSWKKTAAEDLQKLYIFNQIRNDIAHGNIQYEYKIDLGNKNIKIFKMSKGEAAQWKEFVQSFADGLSAHVNKKL